MADGSSLLTGSGIANEEIQMTTRGEAEQINRSKLKYDWEWKPEFSTWELKLPVKIANVDFVWHVWFQLRPYYCDRGRWHCCVDGVNTEGPDNQEGFPRYYFSIQRGLEEIEEWIDIRTEVVSSFKAKEQ